MSAAGKRLLNAAKEMRAMVRCLFAPRAEHAQPILVDREGVAYPPVRRVVVKGKAA